MNISIVYFSKYGNTQRLAEALAESLDAKAVTHLFSLDQLPNSNWREADLILMGSPTHNMNLPEAVRPVLASLPRKILPKTPVAAFDTSYKMSPWLSRFSAGNKLASKLRKLGGKLIAAPETVYVMGKEGPLYEGEIQRAQSWALAILERMHPEAGN
jgi:flavodoxin